MKYLGIDYGDKKIGLALGDESGVAVPLEVVPNDLGNLSQIIREEQIDEVIVGVPISTVEGPGSAQLEKTRGFITKLQAEISIPVHEADERYTTAEAIRSQKESGATADEDAIAAAIILQAHFDENK